MMRNRRAIFVVFMTLLLFIPGLGSEGASINAAHGAGKISGANPEVLASLYQKAKEEGRVVFWASVTEDDLRPLITEFEKRFPGVKVDYFRITAGQQAERTIAEARAGKLSRDVGNAPYSILEGLLERKLVEQPGDWTNLLDKASVDMEGRAVKWYNLVHPIAYNTDMLAPGEAPKTWEDLLAPRWKGKILVEARGKPIAYLALEWGEDRAVEYAKKLAAQSPIYLKGGPTTMQNLVAGEAPLAIGVYLDDILQYKSKGAPVEWIRVPVMGASSFVLYILKGAPHPNAAKLLVAWLGSKDAKELLEKSSFRSDMRYGQMGRAIKEAGIKVHAENASTADFVQGVEEKIQKALKTMR